MICFERVSIAYPNHPVLSDFSENITKGELVCLTGPSGCGKTSLLLAILGFLTPESGKIRVDGIPVDAEHIAAIRSEIAYLPQELKVPVRRVRDLVQLPFHLKVNRHLSYDLDELFLIWERLGLDRKLYTHNVLSLSGGQRQKIMLSVSALLKKKIYLLDEPTSAMDAESVQKIITLLKKLCQEGATILAVSHDPVFAEHCDRVIALP